LTTDSSHARIFVNRKINYLGEISLWKSAGWQQIVATTTDGALGSFTADMQR
jgi:hypothetical protein